MKAIDLTYRISSIDGLHLCDASFKIRMYRQQDGKIDGLIYIVLSSTVPNSAERKSKDEISFGWSGEENSARSWIDMVISTRSTRTEK